MNKTEKRQSDLRNKLVAAVAMLLVSCIMMVSTTYAWFTLSTAPEIQGITTTVGANGNLEIALSPYSGDAKDVSSSMGDANKDWVQKNLTWGNLLNLSDNSVYGLDKIVLQPAKLNVTGTTASDAKLGTAPLGIPTYAADGRPQALSNSTSIGSKYILNDAGEYVLADAFTVGGGRGVRVVGTSASMSEWEIAFTEALSALASSASSSKTAAQSSLNNNGSALAGMVIAQALGTETNFSSYVDDLQKILEDLTTANNHLLDAIVAAMKAEAAAAVATGETFNAERYTASKNLTKETYSSYSAYAATHSASVQAAAAIYASNAEDLAAAISDLTALSSKDNVTWGEINGVLHYIMNTSSVTVNGKTTAQIQAMEMGAVAALLMGGVSITMGDGSGMYADFGAAVGNLEARVRIPEFTYAGGPMSTDAAPLYASMVTDSETVEGGHMTAVRSDVAKKGAYTGDASASVSQVIDVQYAYIVDFMLRTNASNSNLLLQTTPAQRVYEESMSSATQGSGSTMTFALNENVLSEAATRNLMESIRVVFFDPKSSQILGLGILDSINAPLVNGEIEASLYLHDFSFVEGELVVGDAIAEENATLCALAANTATAVSAMVYLDGENVTNADVANGKTSLNGALNLQFASDANLVPMENTALKEMEGEGEFKATVKANGAVLKSTTVTADAPFNYTVPADAIPSGYTITGVTVTMGGTDITSTVYNEGAKSISIPSVTGAIEVIVTYQAN